MRVLDVPQTGSRGNIVASRNLSGPYHRERVSPDQPATAAQCAAWVNMKDVSWLWNSLEEQQRADWRRLAGQVHSRSNLGQSGPLNGCQLFKKINRVLATCRREPLFDPPPLPEFGPNPVNGFEIRNADSGIVFTLQVSLAVPSQVRPPLEDLMVRGWAPFNPGAESNGLYAFLGLLPPPVDRETEITGMYLAKLNEWRKLKDKRYHIPLEGSKVFIQVVQQVNGWVNELGMFQANALVPANRDRVAGELAEIRSRWPVAQGHQ